MDRRGIAETVGAALVSGGLAVAALWLFVGAINWILVVGLVVCVGLATAANYRGRTGHARRVAERAPNGPVETDERYASPADESTGNS